MSQTESWTIGRLLNWTTKYLGEQGADSPRLDAEVLLAEARGCKRIELYTSFDEVAAESVRTTFRDLVRRRAEGMPVAYLVGRREFYSMNFRVTPDVLIPRPETELLVIRLLDLAKATSPEGAGLEVADIGTGSGIIAVCAAKHLPQARVTAVDISPAALQVAQTNAAEHGVSERIAFVEGDLFAAVSAAARFDIVASNPPYVTADEMDQLEPTVRDYEPRTALQAGPTGMAVIERLIPEAAGRLKAGGWLLMEIGHQQGPVVEELLNADGRFGEISLTKDLAGRVRLAQARRT